MNIQLYYAYNSNIHDKLRYMRNNHKKIQKQPGPKIEIYILHQLNNNSYKMYNIRKENQNSTREAI